jgi:hypothetical protein
MEMADRDLVRGEIDIFDAQATTLEEPETAP